MHDAKAEAATLVAIPVRGSLPAEVQGLLPALSALLLQQAETIPDVGSNKSKGESFFVNKWLSNLQLFRIRDPVIIDLVAAIERHANAKPWPHIGPCGCLRVVSMWAMVSRAGMAGSVHKHSGTVSGAFYVDAGQGATPDDGALMIHAASGAIMRMIRPRSGLLLLWPSSLLHSVKRYDGDRQRIVISFNLAPS